MKKANQAGADPDLLAEYDFSGGERGKYAARYLSGSNIVVLEPDVAEIFPDSESVNAALRVLANLVRERVQNRQS